MIVNVYYISFDLKEVEEKYNLFKEIYKRSHGCGVQIQGDKEIYVACKTPQKRQMDYILWKENFDSAAFVFKEGIVESSYLGEEGKLKNE